MPKLDEACKSDALKAAGSQFFFLSQLDEACKSDALKAAGSQFMFFLFFSFSLSWMRLAKATHSRLQAPRESV